MTDLVVRPARPADAERVCAVHSAAIRELGTEAYSAEQVAAWDGDRSPDDYDLDPPDGTFLVAERESVVGFGELREQGGDDFARVPDAYGEVRAVYVHPDAARDGVGSRLLRAVEVRAREADLPGLGLWASKNAVPFYEHHGYERHTVHDHEFGDTGVFGRVFEMAKEW